MRTATAFFVAAVMCVAAAAPAGAATLYWDGVSGQAWSTLVQWSTASGATTPNPTAAPGAADVAYFNISTVNTAQTVNLTANAAALGLVFRNTSTTTLVGSGGNRILSLGTSGITVNSGAGASTIGSTTANANVAISLQGAQSWNSGGTGILTIVNGVSIGAGGNQTLTLTGSNTSANVISGIISNGAATLSIEKTDTGLWQLSGANTFTGGVTLTSGTLKLGNNAALGGAGTSLTINGGTLDVTAAISVSNVPTYTWNGDFAFTGSNTLNLGAGAVSLGTAAGTARTITADASILTVGGVISDGTFADSLTKDGAGTLYLSGANAYTGVTTVSAGVLRANSGTGLPTNSLLTLNGGVFETGANLARTGGSSAGNMEITGGTSGFSATAAIQVAFGTLVSPTDLTWGTAPFAPDILVLNASSATNTLDFKNAIDLGASAREVSVNANTATMSGLLSGTGGGLTKTGTGTLVLTKTTNNYTGTTTVSAGVLRATNGTSLPTNSLLTINGGVFETGANLARTGGSTAGEMQITGGTSGFSAYGAAIQVAFGSLVSPTDLTWSTAPFAPDILVLNASTANNALDFKNAIDLGASAREVSVNANTATMSGLLSAAPAAD